MEYVLNNCDNETLYEVTGCQPDGLKAWQLTLRELIVKHVDKQIIPEKYKK